MAPNLLTAEEIKILVDVLALREETLILLAAATGLRQSELFALKMVRCRLYPGNDERDPFHHIWNGGTMQNRIIARSRCPSIGSSPGLSPVATLFLDVDKLCD
jgi:hypothetical protein